ncbi:MAG TPA: 2-phospho-L-lactate guanylyltransferase [Candidatus Limnocylindria bacterium]
MSTTTIVILARDPRGAKRRLRGVLTPAEREALSRAMLADVIVACRATGNDVLVITASPAIARLARAAGVGARRSDARGTRAAARAGVAAAAAHGASAVLLLPGDLPLLRATDVRRILAAEARADVVVVADRHRHGTNALLLRPPVAIAPLFGPASFVAHVEAARRRGLRVSTPRIAGVGLDVDTPEDLWLLRRKRRSAGTHTAAVLRKLP